MYVRLLDYDVVAVRVTNQVFYSNHVTAGRPTATSKKTKKNVIYVLIWNLSLFSHHWVAPTAIWSQIGDVATCLFGSV